MAGDGDSFFWTSFVSSPVNDWLYISGNPVDSDLETGSSTSVGFLEPEKSISVAPKRAPSRERVILDELSVLIRERVVL